jgi:hypothetical protein
MKKLLPLFLTVAICAWAADFWQAKPFTDWSEKDIQKMETNSPWAKQVPVGFEGGAGSSGGKGSRKGGGGGGGGGGDDAIMGNGGNAGGSRSGVQEVGGGSAGAGGATMTLTVCWRTALPVREALVTKKFGAEAATSPDAKKLLEVSQNFYGIVVTGLPARSINANSDKMKAMVLQGTTLSVKGRDPIAASDLQTGGNERNAVVLFLFPKTSPLSLDDKEVEFTSRLGPLVVRQKFHLKEMVFNGKLEL